MGMCKTLGVSPDYVLNMKYENFLMYGYATPTYDSDEGDGDTWDQAKDANDPSNFAAIEGEEIVKTI